MNTTKTTQFTPGPWNVETTNTLPGECADNVHRLCYPGYRIHGICAIWNNTRTSKANAHLIAAAPTMYGELSVSTNLLCRALPYLPEDVAKELVKQRQINMQVLSQAEGRHHE